MKIKKHFITLAVFALALFLALGVFLFPSYAYAKESENSGEEVLEEKALTERIAEYVESDLIPVISGLLTALTAILAILVPYIKTLGKLKSTQSAYACVYDENERLQKLASESSAVGVAEKITEEVAKSVGERFDKYDELLSALLQECETTSCQLSSLVAGAKIAWKEAEGAELALASSPTATALKKNALAVEFLKSFVAKTLGVKREEIDAKIDEELKNV